MVTSVPGGDTMALALDTDNMTMDDTAFAQYAEQLEREDFESDMLKLCCR